MKIKPRLAYTLLCDDVRQEMGGKFSLMGLFESIYSNTFPAIHPRFAIINEWTGGKGEFRTTVKLLSPDKKTVLSESEAVISLYNESQKHRDITIRFNTTFSQPGTYWIEMLLDSDTVSLVPLSLQVVTESKVH